MPKVVSTCASHLRCHISCKANGMFRLNAQRRRNRQHKDIRMFDIFLKIAPLVFIVTGLVLLYGARAERKMNTDNGKDDADLNALQSAQKERLKGGKGYQGELNLIKEVTRTLDLMGIKYHTHLSQGFEDAVILPKGRDPYSKEIDLLLVCEFGVYVFEAKDWYGLTSRSGERGKITVSQKMGASEDRNDPLPKTISKMELLGSNLSINTYCKAVVVITDRDGIVHPQLNTSYLHLNEVSYFLRIERENSRKPVDLDFISREVFGQLDISPTAKHDHMMRLSPDEGNVKIYQDCQAKIDLLKDRLAQIKVLEGKPVRWFVSAVIAFLFAGATIAAGQRAPAPKFVEGAKTLQSSESAKPVAVAKKPIKKVKVQHQAAQ